MSMDGRGTLDVLVSDLEAVVAAIPVSDDTAPDRTAYAMLDRLDLYEHLGVIVSVPETKNTENNDGAREAWHEDRIVVGLRYKAPTTAGQRGGRDRALKHEAAIRQAIRKAPLLAAHQPRFEGARRQPSSDKAWYEIDQTFRFWRFEVGA